MIFIIVFIYLKKALSTFANINNAKMQKNAKIKININNISTSILRVLSYEVL